MKQPLHKDLGIIPFTVMLCAAISIGSLPVLWMGGHMRKSEKQR